MGVGDAYLGVKQLLTSRGTFPSPPSPLTKPIINTPSSPDCRHRIPCILSFVSGSLRPVKSETDPQLSAWYKSNSLIYVSPDHACWNDEAAARKVKKQRFGGVRMSEVKGLSAMLRRYAGDAMAFVAGKTGEMLERLRGEGDKTEEDEEGFEGVDEKGLVYTE